MEKSLQTNWTHIKLGDLSTIQSGGTPARGKTQYWNGKIPWVKISDIKSLFVNEVAEYITDEGLNNSSAKIFEKGTVLFTIFASIGKVGILGIDAATNQAIVGITPSKEINSKYLTYSLINLSHSLIEKGKGIAQKNINLTILKNTLIPLAPLSEQTRIATKLDRLFSHLDKLKVRLDTIPVLLKQFRQAVLTQAVTGKLTESKTNWGEDIISNLSTKVGSGATPKGGQASYKSEGIPLIRSMNIHFSGIKYEGLAFIDEDQAEGLKNVVVKKDDVLLNITGASIGRVCLAEDKIVGGRVNQHVCIIRTNKRIIPAFLNIYLAAPVMQDYIFKENYGVTRQALTKSQILGLRIPLPSIEEQKEIVKQVENLFSKVDNIETQYKTLKEYIDNLPQAILAKAFRGELVEQDPEGEPAEILLERIKAETGKAEKVYGKLSRRKVNRAAEAKAKYKKS